MMNIIFAPRGVLQIDDARIVFRNFSGAPSKFNREGDRNFALVIPDKALAERLQDDGWNVKIKPPREEGDDYFCTLAVKVKFNDRGPKVYLRNGKNMITLNEDTIDCLDHIDIATIDMDLRPYDWCVNGKEGRSAYLQSMCVTQESDRFADRYANNDDEPEEVPW